MFYLSYLLLYFITMKIVEFPTKDFHDALIGKKIKSHLKPFIVQYQKHNMPWIVQSISILLTNIKTSNISPQTKVASLYATKCIIDTCQYFAIAFVQAYLLPVILNIALYDPTYEDSVRGSRYFLKGYEGNEQLQNYGFNYIKISTQIVLALSIIKPKKFYDLVEVKDLSAFSLAKRQIQKTLKHPPESFSIFKDTSQKRKLFLTKFNKLSDDQLQAYQDFINKEFLDQLKRNFSSKQQLDIRQIFKTGDSFLITGALQLCNQALSKTNECIVILSVILFITALIKTGNYHAVCFLYENDKIKELVEAVLAIAESGNRISRGQKFLKDKKGTVEERKAAYIQFLKSLQYWAKTDAGRELKNPQKPSKIAYYYQLLKKQKGITFPTNQFLKDQIIQLQQNRKQYQETNQNIIKQALVEMQHPKQDALIQGIKISSNWSIISESPKNMKQQVQSLTSSKIQNKKQAYIKQQKSVERSSEQRQSSRLKVQTPRSNSQLTFQILMQRLQLLQKTLKNTNKNQRQLPNIIKYINQQNQKLGVGCESSKLNSSQFNIATQKYLNLTDIIDQINPIYNDYRVSNLNYKQFYNKIQQILLKSELISSKQIATVNKKLQQKQQKIKSSSSINLKLKNNSQYLQLPENRTSSHQFILPDQLKSIQLKENIQEQQFKYKISNPSSKVSYPSSKIQSSSSYNNNEQQLYQQYKPHKKSTIKKQQPNNFSLISQKQQQSSSSIIPPIKQIKQNRINQQQNFIPINRKSQNQYLSSNQLQLFQVKNDKNKKQYKSSSIKQSSSSIKQYKQQKYSTFKKYDNDSNQNNNLLDTIPINHTRIKQKVQPESVTYSSNNKIYLDNQQIRAQNIAEISKQSNIQREIQPSKNTYIKQQTNSPYKYFNQVNDSQKKQYNYQKQYDNEDDQLIQCPYLNPRENSYYYQQEKIKQQQKSKSNKKQFKTFKDALNSDGFDKNKGNKQKMYWLKSETTSLVKPITYGNNDQRFRVIQKISVPQILQQHVQKYQQKIKYLEQDRDRKVQQLRNKLRNIQIQKYEISSKIKQQQKQISNLKQKPDNNSPNNQDKISIDDQNYLIKKLNQQKNQGISRRKVYRRNKTHSLLDNPGVIINTKIFDDYFQKFQSEKQKKMNLKNKQLLYKDDKIQIGCMGHKQGNSYKVTCFITPEHDITLKAIQSPSNQNVNLKIQVKQQTYIPKGKQQRVHFIVDLINIPYSIPPITINFYNRTLRRDQKISVSLPVAFHKFIKIVPVTPSYFMECFKNNEILRGQQIPYSKKIIKNMDNIQDYFPHIQKINTSQVNHSGQIIYGGQAQYNNDNNKYSFVLQISIKPNQFLYIQVANHNNNHSQQWKQIVQFYVATLYNFLIKKQLN